MPGVLMLESLSQVAAILLLQREDAPPNARVYLRGVNDAKFRRQVVPGDRLRLEITLGRRRASLARAQAAAYRRRSGRRRSRAAARPGAGPDRDRSDRRSSIPRAQIGEGTTIGPHATIGPHVRIGANCRIGASAVIDGWTEIGDDTEIYPFASIGLMPQDLKFRGEETRLVIGHRNIFREFVTIHRGTRGGGGVTTIGDRNVFMAYVHVAHDCHVGNDTIFGNMATLGGHVTVEDFANISAGSGVHQFCRVGRHAFIGGYSVVTKDALPYARTVGSRPARIFGVNTIGLMRRGFSPDVDREAEAVVPLPAAVEAEHDERAAADRAGPVARLRRSAVPDRLHPLVAARRHPAARVAAGRRSARRRVSRVTTLMADQRSAMHASGSDRRQWPLSLPRPRRRARRRPRRHRHRPQGRNLSRSRRRSRRGRRRPRSTGSRSASSASASAC